MPFIHVQTNTAITDEQAKNIKTHLGLAITAVPGKTENWLMVETEGDKQLFFQGTDAPAAMVEVQLYGKVQCAEYADQQHYRNSAGYTKNSNRQNLCKLYVYRELGLEQLEFLMGNKNAVPVRDVL